MPHTRAWPRQDAQFSDTFGDLYAGAQTDIAAVRSAVEWARSLRVMIKGTDTPLTPAQVKEADSAVPTGQLAAAAETWQRAREALVEAFDASRRADLAAELDDFDDARELISALREDTGGQGRMARLPVLPDDPGRLRPRDVPSISAFPSACRPGRCPS